MQPIKCLLSNFYLNMYWASSCPSSGEQGRVLLHMVFCTGCEVGCGCVELCHKQCAVWTVTFTQCTLLTTQLHTTTASLSQHNQCRTPYAVVHSLVLLTMGTMMPETCWDRSLIINIWLVASCWFLSLHTTWCGVFLSINLLHMKPWACMDVCP